MSDDIPLPPGLPDWIADHVRLYLSDPKKAHLWDASLGGGEGLLPTLLLITRGRRTGRVSMLPLIYRKVGDTYVVIASKGGAPQHPAWFLNLEAEPNCEIRVGPEKHDARARVAEGAERESLWSQLVDIYAPYEAYQERAGDRQIPVVVLEPV